MPFDLAAPEPVAVVHFWATWNGHDREMEARLNKLSDVFDVSFPLRTCDCDEPANRSLVHEANIATIPTLVFVVKGVPQDGKQIVGLRSVKQLRSQLVEWRDAIGGGLSSV